MNLASARDWAPVDEEGVRKGGGGQVGLVGRAELSNP